MRCVLHIGTEKTGTTLLQDWLYANKESLSERRIGLSDNLGGHNNFFISEYFQTNIDKWALEQNISNLAQKQRYFTGFRESLERELRVAAEKFDVFVMTSEFLHSRLRNIQNIENLKTFLFDNFEQVNVVCYFREQCSMATSLYTTDVLRECGLSLDDYLDNGVEPSEYYYDLCSVADNWSAVFGRGNCVFRVYDRRRFIEGDIRKDFLDAAGLDVSSGAFDSSLSVVNASLSELQGIALVTVNRMLPFFVGGTRRWNQNNIRAKQYLLSLPELRRGRIKSANPDRISDRFAQRNRTLFDCYFEGEDIFASTRAALAEVNLRSADAVTDHDRERAAALAAAVVREIGAGGPSLC